MSVDSTLASRPLRIERVYVHRLGSLGVPIAVGHMPWGVQEGYVTDPFYAQLLHACGWRGMFSSEVDKVWRRTLWLFQPSRLAQVRLGTAPEELVAELEAEWTRTKP